VTLWTLDSCGFSATDQNCQIFINDQTGEETFVRKCPVHAAASEVQVHQENSRGPSNTLDNILQNAPAALFDLQADGSRTFKRGATVSWSWAGTPPNRVLNVNISGITLTTTQQNNLQTAANNRFGAGKVVLTYG
jgi:hypothetical protein